MSAFEQTIGELRGRIKAAEDNHVESKRERAELFSLVREIHGDVKVMKSRQEQVGALQKEVDDLKTWHKVIVVGTAAAWTVFSGCCYAAWDYAKEHFVIHIK